MLGVCEAFAMAEKLGLKAERFFDIASQSSGQCWASTSYCPGPGVGPATPATGSSLALLEGAEACGAETPMGAHAERLYAEFNERGFGDKDFSAVLQRLRGHLDELEEEVRGGR